jgi:hypothetical protein
MLRPFYLIVLSSGFVTTTCHAYGVSVRMKEAIYKHFAPNGAEKEHTE